MDVNMMLHKEINKIDHRLMPANFEGDLRAIRLMQDNLSKVIDTMGEQSAAAQGLTKIITSSEKLRNAPTHILYLLKDAKAKEGKGQVIGLLKVAPKHLFFHDMTGKVCEVDPMCVLDFFVLPDYQRAGCGKFLFDHMLQDLRVSPQELAIDGPSMKMEKFLQKYYDLKLLPRQNNNFAVSQEFFNLVPIINKPRKDPSSAYLSPYTDYKSVVARTQPCIVCSVTHNRHGYDSSKSGRSTPVESPAIGRFAAHKPQCAVGTIIHGCLEDCTCSKSDHSSPGSTVGRFAALKLQLEEKTDIQQPSTATDYLYMSGRNTPVQPYAAGRFTAPKPHSALGNIIHGAGSKDSSCKEMASTVTTPLEAPLQSAPLTAQPTAPPTAPSTAQPTAQPEQLPESISEVDAEDVALKQAPNAKTERPSTLSVGAEPLRSRSVSPAGSTVSRRPSQLTNQGYFDVKFYHNKLW